MSLMEPTWGQRLIWGASSGTLGGVASAALLWVLVEPAINQAIAIEESRDHGHAHADQAGAHTHEHAEVVTRLQQQVGGTVTVVVVAVLLGLAYAVVYARISSRMPGATHLGRSIVLAALAFVAFALMPAIVVAANPPAVGDPETVNQRSATYLATIVLSVLAIIAVFALERSLVDRGVGSEIRWIAAAAAGVGCVAAVLLLMPGVDADIPRDVPAELIWDFRIGSLAQLAGMWVAIGVTHGALAHRWRRRRSTLTPRYEHA